MSPDLLVALLGMALVTVACRVGGFVALRYLPMTPRLEAWLRAVPLAVMGAVLGPIALQGGPPEWAGLAVTALAMRLSGNDFVGFSSGLVTVALLRALGL